MQHIALCTARLKRIQTFPIRDIIYISMKMKLIWMDIKMHYVSQCCSMQALFIALGIIWESNRNLSFSFCFAFRQMVCGSRDLQESSVLSIFRVGEIGFLKGGDLLTCPLRQPSSSSRAPSTDLPTWQQNTFTYKDFYYFCLILSRPQPWKSASPTLKDARTRNAVVSLLVCLWNCQDFKDARSW